MIEAVVFDLDGTLVHLPIDYEWLFQEFKRILQVENIHPVLEVVSKADVSTRGRLFAVWENAELAALRDMRVNDEGMRVYADSAPKPRALVTMQGENLVARVVGKLGLRFDVVVTREDSLSRVQQLKQALARLGKDAEMVLFVGNTEADASAAGKVGCQFLLVEQH